MTSVSYDEHIVVDLSDPLTHRILDVCDRTGDFIEWWGFRAIHGRVWTLLAMLDRPMAQVDIAHVLGVSTALVNGAVRELEELGLVQRTTDHRQAPVVAVFDVWPVITHVLRGREWLLLEHLRLALDAARLELELRAARSIDTPYSLERLLEIDHLTMLAQRILRVILELRTIPRGRGVRYFMRAATFAIEGLRKHMR